MIVLKNTIALRMYDSHSTSISACEVWGVKKKMHHINYWVCPEKHKSISIYLTQKALIM